MVLALHILQITGYYFVFTSNHLRAGKWMLHDTMHFIALTRNL